MFSHEIVCLSNLIAMPKVVAHWATAVSTTKYVFQSGELSNHDHSRCQCDTHGRFKKSLRIRRFTIHKLHTQYDDLDCANVMVLAVTVITHALSLSTTTKSKGKNDYEGSFNVLYDTSNHLRFENITKICTVDHKDGVYMYIYVYVYIYI